MHRFMAARAPATAALQERRMVPAADENDVRRGLLLEVALEAKILVPLDQHLVVHRSVRIVAGGAAFADGLVLKHKRAALRNVALGTSFVLGSHGEWRPDRGWAFMRIMAIAAAHLPMHDRMGVRQVESALHLQMTIETHLWRPRGINDGVSRAAALHMQAAGAVATFAPNVLGMDPVCFEPRVSGCGKILVNLRVAFGAGGGPDKLCAWNFRRRHHHPVDRHT